MDKENGSNVPLGNIFLWWKLKSYGCAEFL